MELGIFFNFPWKKNLREEAKVIVIDEINKGHQPTRMGPPPLKGPHKISPIL